MSLVNCQSDHLSLLLFPAFLLPIPSHRQGSDILNSEIRGEGSRSWLCYTQPRICQKGLLMITDHWLPSQFPSPLQNKLDYSTFFRSPELWDTMQKHARRVSLTSSFIPATRHARDIRCSCTNVAAYFQAATAVRERPLWAKRRPFSFIGQLHFECLNPAWR
jgi:hypothetical protein